MMAPGIADARQLFRRRFGSTPTHEARAPGRLELLGNHTGHHQGLVLTLAIQLELTVACSPRADHRIELVSDRFPDTVSLSASRLARDPGDAWTNHVLGVLSCLKARGVAPRGFNAAVAGTLPPGGGLGAATALRVAMALAFRELHPFELTETGTTAPPIRDAQGRLPALTKPARLALSRLCWEAGHRFVGDASNWADAATCLFGKPLHALEVDCQSGAVEPLVLDGSIALVTAHTGVRHPGESEEWSLLRALGASAARQLGLPSLRALDAARLKAGWDRLSAEEAGCARHVLEENTRVLFASRAIREGDFAQLGQFMNQSHDSSRQRLGNSSPELDVMVTLARRHPACLGSRLMGSGWGGPTVHLVREDGVGDFMAYLAPAYEKATGLATTPIRCLASRGSDVTI